MYFLSKKLILCLSKLHSFCNWKGSGYIKNIKIRFIVFGIIFCILMSISGIYVIANQGTNKGLSTDLVDIEVKNYKLDEDENESEFGDEERKVIPGEEFSIIPKVFNLGMDCYLRIKVNYINEDTDFIDYVTGFSGDFTKYGEYYYYNTIFKSNENVKIFDTIRIPEDVASRVSNGKIKLQVIAEAIQEKNFQPDYALADPWKNVQPSKTVNSTYEIDDKSNVTINYENNTDKDISVSDGFFERTRKMVPGDNFTDSIKIKNANKDKAKYYLSFKTDEKDIKEIDLLNQIQLIITKKDGQVVYQGKLLNEGKLLLGEYKLGEDDELYFNVIVPEDLDNQYENLSPKLILVFSSEYETKDNTIILPITGDPIQLAITMFCVSTIGLVTVMLLAYRDRKKEY